MWRIFCFLQLAQLLESLEYCDEAVWFPREAELENNMGWKTRGRKLGIIEETASHTDGLIGIDGITSGTLIEKIFFKKRNFILIESDAAICTSGLCCVDDRNESYIFHMIFFKPILIVQAPALYSVYG